jgi:hypothetical protein
MMICFSRAASVVVLAAALASCQPPDRDIVVRWHNGQLVVDFPWSLWRLVGLQDKTYCIRRVELFDGTKLLWILEMIEADRSCLDVTMPLKVGGSIAGFVSKGRPAPRWGVRYGIAIAGIGRGRVDFTLRADATPENVRDWEKQMQPPCGSYFDECAGPPLS